MYLDNVGRVLPGRRVVVLRNTGYDRYQTDWEQDGRADNLSTVYWSDIGWNHGSDPGQLEVAGSCNCAHEIFALDSIPGPGLCLINIFLVPRYF